MLALPISTPVVPASANLPFLFRLDKEGVLESNEWEGVRDFIPSGRPSLGWSEKGAFAKVDGLCLQLSPLSACDVCEDAALSMLAILDKDAIFRYWRSGLPSDGRYRTFFMGPDNIQVL